MPTNTTNMALPKPIDSDNAEVALASSIPSAFDKIDVHRHTGGTDGLTIPDMVTLTGSQILTNKSMTAPNLTNPAISGGGTVAAGSTGFAASKLIVGDGAAQHSLVSEDQTQTLTNKTIAAVSPLTVGALRVVVNDQAADAILITGTGTSSSAGAVTVTFSRAFSNTPIVVATPVTATLGLIGITIASVSTTVFTFRCYDSNNVILNGIVIEFIAFGAR